MNTLVSKDEPLKTSLVNVGSLVLKELGKAEKKRLTLPALFKALEKRDVTAYRPVIFGLIFLDSIRAIEFEAPFFTLKENE